MGNYSSVVYNKTTGKKTSGAQGKVRELNDELLFVKEQQI
jgi:hypothetical protein